MICQNCKVTVLNSKKICPLCDLPIEGDAIDENGFLQQAEDVFYPTYTISKKAKARKTILQVLLFLLLSGSFISMLINGLQLEINHNYWSAIVVSALLYCYMGFRSITSVHLNTGAKYIVQLILLSFLLTVIDSVSGFHRWSINYVIPFLSIGTTLLLMILAHSKYYRYKEYIGYVFASLLLGLIPLFVVFIKIATVAWPSLAAFCVSMIIVILLFTFADTRFKSELLKRFHIN